MKKIGSKSILAVILATVVIFVGATLAAAAEQAAGPAGKMAPKGMMAKKAKVSKAWVKKVQTALNKAGYKVKVDGIIGKETRAAVKDFQKKNGLKATGRLDKATQAKLMMAR